MVCSVPTTGRSKTVHFPTPIFHNLLQIHDLNKAVALASSPVDREDRMGPPVGIVAKSRLMCLTSLWQGEIFSYFDLSSLPRGLFMVPFLKWPGGKQWFVTQHACLLPSNYVTYIEPFLGSGAVSFHLQPRKSLPFYQFLFLEWDSSNGFVNERGRWSASLAARCPFHKSLGSFPGALMT